jgi:hypothetical protein
LRRKLRTIAIIGVYNYRLRGRRAIGAVTIPVVVAIETRIVREERRSQKKTAAKEKRRCASETAIEETEMVMETPEPERTVYKYVVAGYKRPRAEYPVRWSKV